MKRSARKAWIDFLPEPREKGHVTKKWCVVPRRDKETGGDAEYVELGIVRWFSSWRRYCFFPSDGSLYDAACLHEIAHFCESETLKHRQVMDRLKGNRA